MKVKQEVMDRIKAEIEALLPTVVDNSTDLERTQKLMSIYASYTAISLNEAQLDMAKASQEFMKNVDFSKIDLTALLKGITGLREGS